MRVMGRTSTFNAEIAAEICNRIAEGEPLRQICRDAHMPAWRTVYDWMATDEDFSAHIARARQLGFDAIAEEALEISDTPLEGVEIEESDKDGTKVKRGDMLGHRKLQVETRLKLLAKWFPQKYGDQSRVELTGANGGPVQFSDEQRAARLAALMALAARRQAVQPDDDDPSGGLV